MSLNLANVTDEKDSQQAGHSTVGIEGDCGSSADLYNLFLDSMSQKRAVEQAQGTCQTTSEGDKLGDTSEVHQCTAGGREGESEDEASITLDEKNDKDYSPSNVSADSEGEERRWDPRPWMHGFHGACAEREALLRDDMSRDEWGIVWKEDEQEGDKVGSGSGPRRIGSLALAQDREDESNKQLQEGPLVGAVLGVLVEGTDS